MADFSGMILLAQDDFGNGAAAAGGFAALFCTLLMPLAIYVLIAVGLWKLFEKAGKPGWAGFIPIYNIVILLEIAGKPLWWVVLVLIPPVFFVIGIIVSIEVAKKFGKDVVFGVLMGILPIIFYPLLGFSDAKYQG